MDKFYVIFNVHRDILTQSHITFSLACVEAERLARKQPEEEFIVFESKAAIKAKKPEPPALIVTYHHYT